MNRENASAIISRFRNINTLPFDEFPHQSTLFIDFQNQSVKNLQEFYPNFSDESFFETALENYEIDRDSLCEILRKENTKYDADPATFKSIDKLRDENCVAVITGQQAGLYGGPIYTIYKALSAVKYAERLNERGIKAVPIFWIASEDHDFDEIKKTYFVDDQGNQTKVQNSPAAHKKSTPVGFIALDAAIDATNRELLEVIEETGFTTEIHGLLSSCYKSGEDFSSAFGKLMARLLSDTGLIFVSPLNEQVRVICSPIFAQAIEASEDITSALLTRNTRLESSGYHSQVLVEKDFFPFFYIDDEGVRNALRFSDDRSIIGSSDSKYRFDKRELIALAKTSPAQLSPNALMRPIVQDYLFPTVKYFGGGAEISYFAQNSAIYEVLDRPVTPIQHRASLTIIEPKHFRTLKKYNLDFEKLFAGKDAISVKIVERYLSPETARSFDEVESVIDEQLKNLNVALANTDSTLSDSLSKRKKKIDWHIGVMRMKYHRAELLKDKVIERRVNSLFETLLPNATLQERTLNALYFYNTYGDNFISWIYELIDLEETGHQVVTL